MRQSHLILSNALVMWAARVFLLVPQVILVPYLIATIGESGYGAYALVWSLTMSIEQLQRSLQSGVVKYSAGFLAQGRVDEVNRVVSSSFVYSLLLAVVAATGILVAAVFYKDPSGQIGTALVVVGIMVLFAFPLTPYIAIIQSRQRYYVGAIADTLSKYVSTLLTVLWFYAVGPSVEALIVIMAAAHFLSKLAQMPIAWRMVPGLQIRFRLFGASYFRLITSFGAVTVLASLCLAANSTGVRWLMASLVSTGFIARLAIMLMPGLLLGDIISAMTITAMPATSAYEATGNHRMLQELLARGIRYTVMLALGGMLVAIALMEPVLRVWVGSDYVFLAPYALILFASAAFMQSTSIVHHMLKGLGMLRAVVFIYCLGLVVIPLAVILSVFGICHNPYLAITMGLAAGHLTCGSLHVVFGVRAVQGNLGRVLWSAYAQPLLVAAAVWLAALGILHYSPIGGLFGRLCISVLAVALFLVTAYLLIATEGERREFKRVAHFVLKRRARA